MALAIAASLAALWQSRNPLTDGAERYAASVAASAGGVYLSLRSLNAVLSTAQEVEVGGSVVVSANAQPLKVLEPIDDTVERIASLVFFVMVVTGVLSVAMAPAAALGFGLVALACALAALRPRGAVALLGARLGLYGLVLALALPGAFVASAMLSDRMTEAALAEHDAVLSEIMQDVAPGDPLPEATTSSWWEGMFDWGADIDRYTELTTSVLTNADALVSSLIGILSVFIFRLLVLPALFLGGALVLARAASASLSPARM